MTEADWLASGWPREMLEYLRASGKASDRRCRLFACGCVRRVWPLLDEWSRTAVEVAEQYADGVADAESLSDPLGNTLAANRRACAAGPDRQARFAATQACVKIVTPSDPSRHPSL